jgi:hypothetical protein
MPIALPGPVGVTCPKNHADESYEIGNGDQKTYLERGESKSLYDEWSPESHGI